MYVYFVWFGLVWMVWFGLVRNLFPVSNFWLLELNNLIEEQQYPIIFAKNFYRGIKDENLNNTSHKNVSNLQPPLLT